MALKTQCYARLLSSYYQQTSAQCLAARTVLKLLKTQNVCIALDAGRVFTQKVSNHPAIVLDSNSRIKKKNTAGRLKFRF